MPKYIDSAIGVDINEVVIRIVHIMVLVGYLGFNSYRGDNAIHNARLWISGQNILDRLMKEIDLINDLISYLIGCMNFIGFYASMLESYNPCNRAKFDG